MAYGVIPDRAERVSDGARDASAIAASRLPRSPRSTLRLRAPRSTPSRLDIGPLACLFRRGRRAARRRRSASFRQAGQHRARGRSRLRRRRRGFARRGSRARGELPLRRSPPGHDGAQRDARRVRRRAWTPHGAFGDPGSVLRAPRAGALPAHGRVADPRGQALRRRRIRPPHRDAQLRGDRRAARARCRRRGEARAFTRGKLSHPSRPSRNRRAPEARLDQGRRRSPPSTARSCNAAARTPATVW